MANWKSTELRAKEAQFGEACGLAGIMARSFQTPFSNLDSKRRSDMAKRAAYLALQVQKATDEQMQFFEAYLKIVFDEAVHVAPADGILLDVSTDFHNVTLGVKASRELMLRLANRFLETCHVPDARMYSRLVQTFEETQGTEVWLLCHIKRIGGQHPGVDFAYVLECHLDWLVLELLLPRSNDQEAFKNKAMGDRYPVFSYGSSLLPIEPESRMSVEIHDINFKASILSALFFFKHMGLAKPEDMLLKAFTSVKGRKVRVVTHLGSKGLTKMSSRIVEPAGDAIGWAFVEEVCAAARHECNSETLFAVQREIGVEKPLWIDFVAESRGYTVSVGYFM